MLLINEYYSADLTTRTTNTCVWDVNKTSPTELAQTCHLCLQGMSPILLDNIYTHPMARNSLSIGIHKQCHTETPEFTLYDTSGRKIISGRQFTNNVDSGPAIIDTVFLESFILGQYGDNAVMEAVRAWLYTATLT